MYPNMYQVMYVEKNYTHFSVLNKHRIGNFFLQGRSLLDKIVGTQKWMASSSIEPLNNWGDQN